MRSARLRSRTIQAPTTNAHNNALPSNVSIKVPMVDPAVVAHLNMVFPDSLALIERLGSVDQARGARRVVEHLFHLIDQQDKS
jgi:hypothetical protein